jgi:hypothetical protein
MNAETLVIPLGFLVVIAIGLWTFIHLKGKWWIKLPIVVGSTSFVIAVWASLASYRGWPTATKTPEKFVLLWGEVREPNRQIGDDGAIFLWVVHYSPTKTKPNLFQYSPRPGEPRAHKVPYSRKLHQQIEEAKELIKQGRGVVMEHEPGGKEDGSGKNRPGKNGDGREGSDGQGQEQEYRFYELPPPRPPNKNQ